MSILTQLTETVNFYIIVLLMSMGNIYYLGNLLATKRETVYSEITIRVVTLSLWIVVFILVVIKLHLYSKGMSK